MFIKGLDKNYLQLYEVVGKFSYLIKKGGCIGIDKNDERVIKDFVKKNKMYKVSVNCKKEYDLIIYIEKLGYDEVLKEVNKLLLELNERGNMIIKLAN